MQSANIIPVSSGTVKPQTDPSKNAVISYTTLSKLQTVSPAIITAMPPKTASDGVRSYVPVMLTTKPISGEGSSSAPAYLGGGVTFVLPSVAASSAGLQVATPSIIQSSTPTTQFGGNPN